MRNRLNFILILVSLVFMNELKSQNFSQDMQKLRDSYSKHYISMNVNYKLFSSAKDVKPEETYTMWMASNGNLLHYKGQGEEVIYAQKNLLIVSDNEKEITLDTITTNYNQPENKLLKLDTISANMKTITFKDLGNNLISYSLVPKNQHEISLMIYTINTKTWLIEKIEMQAGSEMGGGKVLITYSSIIKLKETPKTGFSFNTFITVKQGGGYQVTNAFRDFKFYHRNNYKNK